MCGQSCQCTLQGEPVVHALEERQLIGQRQHVPKCKAVVTLWLNCLVQCHAPHDDCSKDCHGVLVERMAGTLLVDNHEQVHCSDSMHVNNVLAQMAGLPLATFSQHARCAGSIMMLPC